MHGIAQVVEQLANDLPLVFLLHAAQDGGGGRGARGGKTRFQSFSPFGLLGAELTPSLVSSLAA